MPGLKGPSNVQQTTSNTPNPVAMAQLQTAVNTGNSVAAQPYQAYNSPLVAGMNSEQQAAFNNVNSAAGLAQPYIGQAANLLQASTSGIDPTQTLNQYMSPYTQNVLQAQQAIQNQQMGQAMTQSAGSSGAAGANNQNSDRAAIAQGLVGQQLQMANNAANANTLQQGYNQALQTGLSAQQANAWLESQGANTMANLGAQAQGQGLAGANAQLAAGNQIQQQAQNQINAPLAQYSAAQQYPFQIANYMGNLGSLATGMGTQASTSIPSASPLSQVAGLGLTGYSLYNNLYGGGSSAASGGASSINDTAATINNLIPNYGSGVANAGTYAHGGAVQHRDAGGATVDPSGTDASLSANAPLTLGLQTLASGSLSPLMQAGLGAGNPMVAGQLQQLQKMPTEQLHEMAVRSPNNPALMQALRQRQMNPQTDPMNGGLGRLGGTGGLGGLPGGVAPAMAHGGVIHAANGATITGAPDESNGVTSDASDVDALIAAAKNYDPMAHNKELHPPPPIQELPDEILHRQAYGGVNPTGALSSAASNLLLNPSPNSPYSKPDYVNELNRRRIYAESGVASAAIAPSTAQPAPPAPTPVYGKGKMSSGYENLTDAERPLPEDKPFAPGTIGGLTAPALPALNPVPVASSLVMSALQDRGPPQEHRGIDETPYKLSQFAGGSPFTDDQIQQMLRTGEMIDPAKLPAGSRLPTGAGPNAGGGGGNAGLRAGVGTANIGQGAGLGVGPQAGQAAPVVGNAGLRAGAETQNAGTTQAPSFSDRFRTAMNDPLTMLGMHLMAGQSRNPLTNLGTAMAGTQQQVEAQAMRQAQARLAAAKETANEEYQRARVANSQDRTQIYGQLSEARSRELAAQADKLTMAAALGHGSGAGGTFSYIGNNDSGMPIFLNNKTGELRTGDTEIGLKSAAQAQHDIQMQNLELRQAAQNAARSDKERLALQSADANTVRYWTAAMNNGKPITVPEAAKYAGQAHAANAATMAPPTQTNPADRTPITNFISP